MNKIPIYVINLRRTPERRLYIQRQLDSLGLEYQWIEAVDAYDFTNTDLEGVNPNSKNQPAAMGCLLSHVKFYDQVIKNNHEIACVLEDDCELFPTFPKVLNYEKLQKENWEILLLLHFSVLGRNLLKQYKKLCLSSSEKQAFLPEYGAYILGAIPKKPLKKYMKDYYIAEMAKPYESHTMQPLGTGAYLVRLSAAKKLREIALANQKFILSDDLIGCANNFGVSLKLITPPCVRSEPKYFIYSTIVPYDNIKASKGKFPDQKILQLYINNKWIVLALSTFNGKLSLKLRMLLLNNLKDLCKLIIAGYLMPSRALNRRVKLAKRKLALKN